MGTESQRFPADLSLEDMYSMAKSLGSELQSLTKQYEPESVSRVVPKWCGTGAAGEFCGRWERAELYRGGSADQSNVEYGQRRATVASVYTKPDLYNPKGTTNPRDRIRAPTDTA